MAATGNISAKAKGAKSSKPYHLTEEEMEALRAKGRETLQYMDEHREEILAMMGMPPSATPST